ncbi:MAG TPA: HAMP domain-containing sensor histidine kinase [Candidatus Polarisedimenticolia bacterium]|nr:HAMP domain-containing sensor histidine kinase [Candidatus Polarisedimenticolia bacterium]
MSDGGWGTRAAAFVRRHTLWAGLVGVLVPLLVLLVLQLVQLRQLREMQAIARRATLDNYLEAIGTEVQYFYRSAAERSLNLPAGWFIQDRLDLVAGQWTQKPIKGASRMFVVDFTKLDTGEVRVLDPRGQRFIKVSADEETMAILSATTPWQMARMQKHPVEGGILTVEERNPDFRVILNSITSDDHQVAAVAGFIVDIGFFRKKLLPAVIQKSLPEFFPGETGKDLEVMIKDGQGRLILGEEHPALPGEVVTSRFPFVFTDWTLILHSHRSTPEHFASVNFAINASLLLLLGGALMISLVLALRAADRAMRLSTMKADFVSNVSHELRTPLASIRVFAELLRLGRVQTPEKVREYGEFIERESRRLSRLIENILDFSRIESGRKTYTFAATDVRQVVEGVLQSFDVHLKHHGFTARLEAPEGALPEVLADADALGQAVHNLLDNAVKFSGEARSIEVLLGAGDGEVTIAVRDRGIGVPLDEQAKIFDRFHRVSTGLVHEVKGSGLGLSLVHHIVTVHGGRVSLESAPGRGSTFILHLPARRPPADEALPRSGTV